ncbi:hypothetical protein NDA11_005799 [Ustilago hordei]|nr:hypothetical protein NDA11_005799 [Ustilago hordei]
MLPVKVGFELEYEADDDDAQRSLPHQPKGGRAILLSVTGDISLLAQGGISSRHDAAPHTLHTRTKANQIATTVVLFKRLYLGEEQRKLPSQGKIAPPPA